METNQATAPESRGRSRDLLRDQRSAQAAQVTAEPELAAAWNHELAERCAQAAKIEALLTYKTRKLEQNKGEHAFTRRAVEKAVTREAATILGLTETAVRRLISTAEFLSEKLPETWETYRAGRIDRESAAKAAVAVEDIAHRKDLLAVIDAEVAERAPKENSAAVGKWVPRRVAELDAAGFQERYDRAQAKRYVKFRHLGNGMSHIEALIPTLIAAQVEQQIHSEARNAPRIAPGGSTTSSTASAGGRQGADQNTAQGAERAASQGADGLERTLSQRIADSFITRLSAGSGEQSQDAQAGQVQTGHVPTGANLEERGGAGIPGAGLPGTTSVKIGILVPVQTLTGDSDEPAVSWDRAWSLPAGTARQIAFEPAAEHEWYIAGTAKKTGVAGPEAAETARISGSVTACAAETARTGKTTGVAELVTSAGMIASTDGELDRGKTDGPAATHAVPEILTVVHPRKGPGKQCLEDWIQAADPVGGNLLTRTYQSRSAKDRQRDAILMRDGQCTQDGCTNSGWQAEIDHTRSFETGGRTTGTNLRVLCRDCHAIKSHQLGPASYSGARGNSGPVARSDSGIQSDLGSRPGPQPNSGSPPDSGARADSESQSDSGSKSPPGPGAPARASPGEDDLPEWLIETRPPPDWAVGDAA